MAVDTLDILTPAEALRALSLSDNSTTFTDELEQTITGISRDIDRLCGPVVARAVTETHDGGGCVLLLDTTPVLTVTSVTEWASNASTALTVETVSSWPANSYLLLDGATHNARIARRSGGGQSFFPYGTSNVIVVYSAGRYATTAAVDRRFKRVAAAVLRAEWAVAAPAYRKSSNFDEDFAAAYPTSDAAIKAMLPLDLLPDAVG